MSENRKKMAPCPFCKSENVQAVEYTQLSITPALTLGFKCTFRCYKCGAVITLSKYLDNSDSGKSTNDLVIELWNRRE